MNDDIKTILAQADTRGWKTIAVEFGVEALEIAVPPETVILRMTPMPALAPARVAIRHALEHPIGSPTLDRIIRSKSKPAAELTVCIAVSDITRPVPYKGEDGILPPLLEHIAQTGVRRENIVIVVGNGMHRPSTPEENRLMFGDAVVAAYRIVDHHCDDLASQVLAATTSRGTEVYVNALFHQADVKIVTGLVESHFMAGASGGRKGVCPALVNTTTLQKFHGVEFLEHPNATNLVLDGNPCHEEALEVAQTVGVDFLVNTTLNQQLQLTGVFAGDLVQAHLAAVEVMRQAVRIPVAEPFDIVLTHAGYVGRNHYQSVKAAVSAMPAVKERGMIIMAANNHDVEPIGSREYKTLLHLLKMFGPERYLAHLNRPDWVFTKDQWEPEMWGKPLRKVGAAGLIYCAPQIPEAEYAILPGVSGYEFLDQTSADHSNRDKAAAMLQNAVSYAVHHPQFGGHRPSIAYIAEGPYAIPVCSSR